MESFLSLHYRNPQIEVNDHSQLSGLSLVLEIVKQTVGRSTKNKREHVSRSYLEGSEFKKMTYTPGISEGSLYHPQTTLDPSRLATELAKNERNTIEHTQSDFHIL
uniref:Uncharacterized protein n=1 Tax=Vespula pensylvanica TaxID=30213 RepID=A0A834PCM6_VESPE|nr:hypothetical protein H0235_003773 [Vespula pensylvanica]